MIPKNDCSSCFSLHSVSLLMHAVCVDLISLHAWILFPQKNGMLVHLKRNLSMFNFRFLFCIFKVLFLEFHHGLYHL